MDDTTDTVQIDETLQFSPLYGEPLSVAVSEVSRDDGDVLASFELDYDTWMRAQEGGAFHLDGVSDAPELGPGRRVELRAQLRPALAGTLDEIDELRGRFVDSGDPVRQTESWFATAIMQAVEMPDGLDFGAGGATVMGVETDWDGFFDDDREVVRDYVTDHFESQGWEYEFLDDTLIRVEITMGGRPLPVYIYADQDGRECLIYSVHPKSIPEEERDHVSRLLAMRNYEVERGAFGLNPADGEVRFRLRAFPDRESFGEVLDRNVSAMAGIFDELWARGEDDDA